MPVLAAAQHICISSQLLPLFLFYLATLHCTVLVRNGLYTVTAQLTIILCFVIILYSVDNFPLC